MLLSWIFSESRNSGLQELPRTYRAWSKMLRRKMPGVIPILDAWTFERATYLNKVHVLAGPSEPRARLEEPGLVSSLRNNLTAI
jgi:hypothetical protein